MPRDARTSSQREREASRLIVKGPDANGRAFSEQTKTIDISETGISFLLQTPIWVDTHLTIEITTNSLLGPPQTVLAKVVRIKLKDAGKQFVAARFD